MIRLINVLAFCLLFGPGPGVRAQAVFDALYRAPDGIYFSHTALVAEAPDLRWRDVHGEVVQLPDDYRLQVENFRPRTADPGPEPYAVVLNGNPYFLTDRNPKLRYLEFTAPAVRGPFASLRYDTTVNRTTLMQAYNPVNGRPFREAYVDRKHRETRDVVIDMRTGARTPLSSARLIVLLYRESELTEALVATRDEERDKLLRALKIYADRRPLLLPLSPPNR